MKWCTKFPKPNLTCFHTTSACWTTSLFDVLKVNWLKIWSNVEFYSNQDCYTPWGSGGWRSWFPGRRRWRWRSCGDQRWGRWWPPSPPPPPPWQLARSPENLACMRKFIFQWQKTTHLELCVRSSWKQGVRLLDMTSVNSIGPRSIIDAACCYHHYCP